MSLETNHKSLEYSLAVVKCTNQLYFTPVKRLGNFNANVVVDGTLYDCSAEMRFDIIAPTYGKQVEIMCLALPMFLSNDKDEYLKFFTQCLSATQKAARSLIDANAPLLKAMFKSFKSKVKTSANGINGSEAYCKEPLKYSLFLKAFMLMCQAHPLSDYVARLTKYHKAINAMDYVLPLTIFSLIDFPITSVANLMRAMGYDFVESCEFINKHITIGCRGAYRVIWIDGNPDSYKLGLAKDISLLVANNQTHERLDVSSALALGILDYMNGDL